MPCPSLSSRRVSTAPGPDTVHTEALEIFVVPLPDMVPADQVKPPPMVTSPEPVSTVPAPLSVNVLPIVEAKRAEIARDE